MISKNYPSFTEIYGRAWRACTALWPLLVARFVFVVANVGAMILCLLLLFGPFLKDLWNAFQNSGMENPQEYFKNFESSPLFNYFKDPAWLAIAFGMMALYTIWWMLLTTLFDAGVYRRFWAYQKNGEPLSFRGFFRDAFQYFLPMLGLVLLWLLVFIFIMAVLGFLSALLILFFHAIKLTWVGVLIFIPGTLLFLLLMFGLVTCWLAACAYLMDGNGVFDALKKAFGKCVENYGRMVWSVFLLWLCYFIFSVVFSLVMNLLGLIPILGMIFAIMQFAVSLAFAVVFWVYIPSLMVAFSLEEEV